MRAWRSPAAPYRWSDLARYNAEVARGLVHTEEWRARMAEQQRAFNLAHGRNVDGSYRKRA